MAEKKKRTRSDSPSPAVKLRRLRLDSHTCQYCGQVGGDLQIDHIVSVANGGSNHVSNLATACADCNRKKSANTWTPSGNKSVVLGNNNENSAMNGLWVIWWDEEKRVKFEGRVYAVDGDVALVQMFSAFDGMPTHLRPFDKSDLLDYPAVRLYAEEIDFCYEAFFARPENYRSRTKGRMEMWEEYWRSRTGKTTSGIPCQ